MSHSESVSSSQIPQAELAPELLDTLDFKRSKWTTSSNNTDPFDTVPLKTTSGPSIPGTFLKSKKVTILPRTLFLLLSQSRVSSTRLSILPETPFLSPNIYFGLSPNCRLGYLVVATDYTSLGAEVQFEPLQSIMLRKTSRFVLGALQSVL
ncbi:hypothetical protein BOTCAL_0355g00030 [Botryotinia calthae]|uniref:Uncharacterized protein n=1 Tax=Botryotinia calthae TaxID=38488 RepID=A0A4Y8CSA6_9HELO|nr:hypothetical protein BOTCAL_0355g00030 [Botryotinia calthae]